MSIHPIFKVIKDYLKQNPNYEQELLPNVQNAFNRIKNHEGNADLTLLSLNFTLPTTLEFDHHVVGRGWDLFQLRGNNTFGLGVIISKAGLRDSNIASPSPFFRHRNIIHPTHKFDIDLHRQAVIYPEFSTLLNYCVNLRPDCHISEVEDDLQYVIRDYILGLLDLHKENYFNGQIELSSLVVVEHAGKFLRPSRVESCSTLRDLKMLGKALSKLASEKRWKILTKEGETYNGLARLINFLTNHLCRRDDCIWVSYFPYILTDKEIMNTYIPRMFDVADKCGQYQSGLAKFHLDWEAEVIKQTTPAELRCVYSYGSSGSKGPFAWMPNYYHFLKYLRNCVAHINSHKHTTDLNKGVRRHHYSTLSTNSSAFVAFIFSVDPEFLERLWMLAVERYRLECVVEAIHPRITA